MTLLLSKHRPTMSRRLPVNKIEYLPNLFLFFSPVLVIPVWGMINLLKHPTV